MGTIMPSEHPRYQKLTVQGTTYETLLTGKFLRRKPWSPPDPGSVACVIPGMILGVCVRPGQKVCKGDPLVTLEAMKMQNDVLSPVDGTVKSVAVAVGARVAKGEVMLVIASSP